MNKEILAKVLAIIKIAVTTVAGLNAVLHFIPAETLGVVNEHVNTILSLIVALTGGVGSMQAFLPQVFGRGGAGGSDSITPRQF